MGADSVICTLISFLAVSQRCVQLDHLIRGCFKSYKLLQKSSISAPQSFVAMSYRVWKPLH